MKAKPTANWKLLGTRLKWDKNVAYPIMHAYNQPNWQEEGKIFMANDPEDTELEGGSILLVAGEYEVVGE